MSDFRKLEVWQLAHQLSVQLIARTAGFAAIERFGLRDQIRRAACSIGANLAEGAGRASDRELLRYVRIARGSAHELENPLLVARDAGILDAAEWQDYDAKVRRIGRMLTGLLRMRTSGPTGPRRP